MWFSRAFEESFEEQKEREADLQGERTKQQHWEKERRLKTGKGKDIAQTVRTFAAPG